jgi:pimeloyl-ACP methyl ester carboxylesterase
MLAACVGLPGTQLSPPDVSFPVDFREIVRFSEDYRIMRYESNEQVQSTVGSRFDEFSLVDLPATRNRYMIGTITRERRQEIWIRGTANFRNALYDLRFGMHRDPRLGINLHRGFESMATAVCSDIKPRLRSEYDLVIFGHSLGAAEAVILAMLLDVDGYRVKKVYASGQPRVTDADGEKRFDHLPILRIMNIDDPVPLLPPRGIDSRMDPFVHIGPALVLLDGPYYSLIGEDRGDEVLAGSFWKLLAAEGPVEPVSDHLIPAYIARLTPKLTEAVQVPWADRARYVGPKAAPAGN